MLLFFDISVTADNETSASAYQILMLMQNFNIVICIHKLNDLIVTTTINFYYTT